MASKKGKTGKCSYHLCDKEGKLYKCRYCDDYFCNKHKKPKPAGPPIFNPQTTEDRIFMEEWRRENAHPCIPYYDNWKKEMGKKEEEYNEALERILKSRSYQNYREETSPGIRRAYPEENIPRTRETYTREKIPSIKEKIKNSINKCISIPKILKISNYDEFRVRRRIHAKIRRFLKYVGISLALLIVFFMLNALLK